MPSKTGRKANAAAAAATAPKAKDDGRRFHVFDKESKMPAYIPVGGGLDLQEATRLATGRVAESYLVEVGV